MSDEAGTSLATLAEKVPEGWRKRVAAVVLQLAVGTRKGADLYHAGRDAIDTAEGRSIVARELAHAVAKQAVEDPEMMERAKARFLGRVITEQENVEAVLAGAGQLLLSGPAPEATANAENQSASTEGDFELDRDWVESFTREAEKATSEGLRERLSRVLAGEITAPGSYPRSVFRKIVELEKPEVEAVRGALDVRAGNTLYLGLLPPDEIGKLRDALIEAELINQSAFTHGGFILREKREDLHFDVLPVADFCLAIESREGHLAKGETIFLNRAGQAAFDIIDDSGGDAPARRFARHLASPETRITLCSMNREANGSGFHYAATEVLHVGANVQSR